MAVRLTVEEVRALGVEVPPATKNPPKICGGCGRPRKACKCLELRLLAQIRAVGLPEPETEVTFHPVRRWRFDLAWPDRKLAVECEGGTWVRGHHSSGLGVARDCEKMNEAAILGWTVLRFTTNMIRDGVAVRVIERAFGAGQ